jgi:hypothetical protein
MFNNVRVKFRCMHILKHFNKPSAPCVRARDNVLNEIAEIQFAPHPSFVSTLDEPFSAQWAGQTAGKLLRQKICQARSVREEAFSGAKDGVRVLSDMISSGYI